MSTFNLGLPTDIPWKRICFTEDMTHAPICGHAPPPKWRSSIAVFGYEPEQEYQLLATNGFTVSYLKVAVTITPDAEDLPLDYTQKFLPRVGIRRLETKGNQRTRLDGKFPLSSPCYGAMLQVSVGPKTSGTEKDIYFADFEPKKRELYESVSQTGEVASGSSSRLSIGKSAMTTHATESSSSYGAGITTGVGAVGSGPAPLSVQASGQWTNRESDTFQQTDLTTTDRSTERRESQSHSTFLSQMYNLFQSFHVGTNRAMFFMEPRPHVVMTESTFINGPRALEGIQEIFLVVVRKSTMPDFCVNVILETAHLENVPADLAGVGKERVEVTEGTMLCAVPEWALNDPDEDGFSFATYSYRPPEGWEIDVAKTKEELPVVFNNHAWDGTMGECSIQSITSAELKLTGKGKWHTYLKEGAVRHDPAQFAFSMTVHLKVKPVAVASTFYLTARNLCCCSGTPPGPPTHMDPRIMFEKQLKTYPWISPTTSGQSTAETLRSSREFSTALRDEMVASLNSPYRFEGGPLPFSQSNVFYTRVATVMKENGAGAELDTSLSVSPVLPDGLRRTLADAFGDMSVGEVVVMNPTDMAAALELTVAEVLAMKDGILRAIANPPAPLPAAPTPKVAGVRVASSWPDPGNPATVVEMDNPHAILYAPTAARPNIIEVRFTEAPDAASLTSASFSAKRSGVPLAAQIQMAGANVVRLVITDALAAGDLVEVTLLASPVTGILFGGRRLDGDPVALPSGNGVEGGNFTFAVKIASEPAARPAIDQTLLTVTGVEIASSLPDPARPLVLARMASPGEVQRAYAADSPNIIDVAFNVAPDAGTVTATSFTVMRDGALVPVGGVTMITPTLARLVLVDPMAAGGRYVVRLNGASSPAITYQGYRLDGEGHALPTGNGSPGGDFTFVVESLAAPATPPAPPAPIVTLKVAAVRLLSDAANPGNPVMRAEMIHPATVFSFAAADAVDTVDVDFNLPPDAGAVTATNFELLDGATPVAANVAAISATRFRLTANAPLVAGTTYTVRLKGAGVSAITYLSAALDGEPVRLPSGDGVAGVDFTFQFAVRA